MFVATTFLFILGATAAASLEDSSKEVGTQTSGIDQKRPSNQSEQTLQGVSAHCVMAENTALFWPL